MGSRFPLTTDDREAKAPLPAWPGGYWDRTDQVQASGRVPTCCGEPMVACDDHGRFMCFSCGNTVTV